VVNRQLAVVSRQWTVGSGQWAVVKGEAIRFGLSIYSSSPAINLELRTHPQICTSAHLPPRAYPEIIIPQAYLDVDQLLLKHFKHG